MKSLAKLKQFIIDGNQFSTTRPTNALYLVATPIGNMADISVRALRMLAGCDLIACEDTRTTGKLLKYYGITTPMRAYHEHNSEHAGPKLIDFLESQNSVALVSDAGTPLISDPGYKLVKSARAAQIDVFPIPGASALLAALVASGLETDQFFFGGFLPSKQSARKKMLNLHDKYTHSLIYYESPNRIHRSIADMVEVFDGERRAAICRELTKLHEQIYTGTLSELQHEIEGQKLRGEIVVVVAGDDREIVVDVDKILTELLGEMSVSRAAGEAAKLTSKPKRELYNRALELHKTLPDE